MPELKNTMDILKLLNKSNCRECGSPTCLAFAAEVFKGLKTIDRCTHLDKAIVDENVFIDNRSAPAQDISEPLEGLRKELKDIDFLEAA